MLQLIGQPIRQLTFQFAVKLLPNNTVLFTNLMQHTVLSKPHALLLLLLLLLNPMNYPSPKRKLSLIRFLFS